MVINTRICMHFVNRLSISYYYVLFPYNVPTLISSVAYISRRAVVVLYMLIV